LQTLDMLPGL